MKKVIHWENGFMYSNWYYMVILIIGVSIAIGYMFSFALGLDVTFMRVFVQSMVSTTLIWGGCIAIVVYSWKKYPWESMPVKHLIIEISAIILLLMVFFSVSNSIVCLQEKTSFLAGIKSHSIEIIITILITFLITTIHEAIFFYQQWKKNFSKSISLEKDNLEARYNALKAQVNPHFLFNSLNSLMNLLDNNPIAEQYVQDLSEYLRYMLLSNSRESVPLQEELDNLEKFFHLQRLRFNENLHVELSIQPASLQLQIPPLALQMLVDNCIKHNIISSQHPLTIKIHDDGKNITVVNNLQRKQSVESTGQGLKNIEGRYRFIAGEAVKIESDENHFSVTIPLINKSKND